MKYLVVFSLIAAVASAGYLKPSLVNSELQEIVDAINSPSTDPATAAALEQLLLATLGIEQPAPAAVEEQSPIAVGPTLVDFPLPDGGLVTAVQPEAPALVPAPVVDATPAAAADSASPLVQIILNINQAGSAAPSPVAPAPVETPVIDVQPVQVVEEAENVDAVPISPVVVVDAVPISPVVVVDAVPEPVQVVDVPVVEVEPIQIGTPVIPAPVVTLPDVLN